MVADSEDSSRALKLEEASSVEPLPSSWAWSLDSAAFSFRSSARAVASCLAAAAATLRSAPLGLAGARAALWT